MLDCSEIDVKMSNVDVETIRFGECKEILIVC